MPYKKIHFYTVKYEPDGEGGYIATVPALPGIVTGGKTLVEAAKNVQEAIELHLEVLANHGDSIPRDVEYKAVVRPKFDRLEVAVPKAV